MGLFDLFRSRRSKATPPDDPETIVPDTVPVVPVDRRMRPRTNARKGTQALIIDDSPTIVAALTKILRSAGYTTIDAGDAEKGIELAREEVPQLIFLDIVLPGMNGFSALRNLRRDPQTMDIPIIMMSGNEHATEQFFGSRIGADDFMKKPFSRHEVFARIERLLDESRIPRRPVKATFGVSEEGTSSTHLIPVLPPISSS